MVQHGAKKGSAFFAENGNRDAPASGFFKSPRRRRPAPPARRPARPAPASHRRPRAGRGSSPTSAGTTGTAPHGGRCIRPDLWPQTAGAASGRRPSPSGGKVIGGEAGAALDAGL